MDITLRELTTDEEMQALWPLIQLLNPDMSQATFDTLLPEMRQRHYRCVAAFDGISMIGACGFWTRVQFWNQRSLQLDNLIVQDAYRSQRIGARLMQWIEAKAREEGCAMLVLDSYVHNHLSHKLYFREGYVIRGYHFTKDL